MSVKHVCASSFINKWKLEGEFIEFGSLMIVIDRYPYFKFILFSKFK